MRINRYVALATGLGRRKVDKLIIDSRITVDGQMATTGQDISDNQKVSLDNKLLKVPELSLLVMLNKPVGFVVSRDGQGAPTIYELLPKEYSKLKPIGRLDKDSSGLLLLSNDGALIQELSHPSNNKKKIYSLRLDRVLSLADKTVIEHGIKLEDGISKLALDKAESKDITVTMTEGRNRQIRRTFQKLNYKVINLNRISFGEYMLSNLKSGEYKEVSS